MEFSHVSENVGFTTTNDFRKKCNLVNIVTYNIGIDDDDTTHSGLFNDCERSRGTGIVEERGMREMNQLSVSNYRFVWYSEISLT